MKHSILFSIFSVAMILGFSNVSWGQQKSNGSGCAVVNGVEFCNEKATGGQWSGIPFQQSYSATSQANQDSNKDECFATCRAASSDCSSIVAGDKCAGYCTTQNAADTQTPVCVSNAKLRTCGGAILSNGSCPNKANVSDDGQIDPNGLGPQGQICNSDVESAESTCDPNKSSDVGAVMQMATGAQQALSMATGSSIAAACGKLGKVSEAAAAATAAYKGYCSYSYSRCQKSCNDALAGEAMNNAMETAAIKRLIKRCGGMQQNIADASNAVLGLLGAKINMDQCKNQVVDCNLNPLAASCIAATDCTNTTVATTNLVCICQSNPTDSRCGGGANLAGGIGGPAGLTSSGSTTDGSLGNFGLGDGNGYGSMVPPGAGTGSNQQPQNLAAGMQGGHNLGNTGGVNNAYTPPGAAGSGNGSKAGILSGYYGGSGSSGFGSGSSGSGSGYGAYPGAGGSGNGKGNLDLKQFLPGGSKDPSRGIAGISGPDGITGPNSDIWQKVNTRYNAKSQGGAFLP